MTPVTPERFLDLFIACGGDYYRRRDGSWTLRAPRWLLDACSAQIICIGRDVLRDEMERQDRASCERLARVLSRRGRVA